MKAKRFTARFVESVTTTKAQEDVPDATVRGLQLRITQAGTKAWAVRYTRKSDGRRRRLTIGNFPAMGLEEARNQAREALAAVARGADPAGDVQARKDAETFAEVADQWFNQHRLAKARRKAERLRLQLPAKIIHGGMKKRLPKALADEDYMLKGHILPVLGPMKAIDIRKRDVVRLLAVVADKWDGRSGIGSRKTTHRANRVHALVRTIFRWAIRQDLLQVDPTVGVKPPIEEEAPRERDLSPEEIRQLWAALERTPVARRAWHKIEGQVTVADGIPFTRPTALAIQLALATGARIGEVAGIAISDLNLSDIGPVWTIPAGRTKNGRSNRLPLSPLACRLIQEALHLSGDSPWLFPNPKRNGPMDAHAPTKALGRARSVIGLTDFRLHDLRRTAATGMAEAGINPYIIATVLNHISVTRRTVTGKHYDRYTYDREKREALEAWGTRLEQIIAGEDDGNVVHLASRSIA